MSAQRYLVTARKYRPQTFGELVAQEHVTETLKNAIRLDRLAHAYLFSGPRGVGKTTAARILAKAINCTTSLEERDGQAEPCRTCESCRTFEEGRSLNIIEIDAASNNRVDDIRELRDTVRIPPQGGRKKVYIVDEVHMLTSQAFNALLKTLEEPPPHVLFIFATTEPHKVLPTILSRCQRFDFRRIAVPEIVTRLREICAEEEITADEASLMLIARKGDGALRDALSVFDQAVSLCGSDIRYSELAQALGVVMVDLYFEVTDLISDRDSAGMLRLIDRTVRSGHDLQEFLSGLTEHFRNLLVARTMEDASLIEAAETTRQRYGRDAQRFSEVDLLRLLTLAEDAQEKLKGASQPRLKLETTMLKMASITLAADLREAVETIRRLEQLAEQGKFPADGGASVIPKAAGRDSASSSEQSANDRSEKRGGTDADAHARSEAGAGSVNKSSAAEDVAARGPDQVSSEMPAVRRTPPQSAGRQLDSASSRVSDVLGKPALRRGGSSSAPAAGPTSAVAVAGDPSTRPSTVDEARDAGHHAGPIGRIWKEVVERVKHDKIQVWSLLHHARPEGYRDEQAVIAVPNDFHRRVLTSQEAYVLGHMRAVSDVPLQSLQFVVRDHIDAGAEQETASDFDPYEYMQRKRQENPVIRAIFDQFGGELVW